VNWAGRTGRLKAGEAAEALEAWQLALSFALCRWIAPVAPVGLDAKGRRVWEQWASWRCDPVATDYLPWWSNADGDDLRAFAELFLRAWFSSDEERAIVRHVAHHLIAAHHWGTTIEAKIMLVHAALEYLSWVTYVLSPLQRNESHHRRTDLVTGAPPATWHLQELLCDAGVDTAIPRGLSGMQQLAQNLQLNARANQVIDGPEVLTWLRNRLVHPKNADEPYRIENLVTEAWRLASEYGELLLLKRIGYQGKYLPRTDTREWVNSIAVPWAS
jgi:hypothetical protein